MPKEVRDIMQGVIAEMRLSKQFYSIEMFINLSQMEFKKLSLTQRKTLLQINEKSKEYMKRVNFIQTLNFKKKQMKCKEYKFDYIN